MHGVLRETGALHASLTMKLVTSVYDHYGMAVTMIKNILLSSYTKSSDAEKWMYVMSALLEEE